MRENQKASAPNYAFYGNPQMLQQWWSSLPPEKFLADHGGILGALNWFGLLYWIYMLLVMGLIGMIWAVLFPRLRGFRRALLALACVAGAASFFIPDYFSSRTWFLYDPSQLIHRQVGWLPAAMSIAFGGLCIYLAASLMRPVARWLVATLLPHRLAVAFSYLWEVDGKPLPRPR
jgi:hypothetical protein